MVHGQGPLKGTKYGHCWLERSDEIIDKSNGKELRLPKVLYYHIGHINPNETKYYSSKETMKWLSKKQNWGPWEMSGDQVKI